VRTPLRTAIEGLNLLGVTPQLYIGAVPNNATVPYAWFRRGGEGPLVPEAQKYEATVYLDIYGRSSQEVQLMENAAAFLDDYNPAPYGNALSIRYFQASKTQLSEGENREHSTILYRVTYADARRLVLP
jgi:hypothetical protein